MARGTSPTCCDGGERHAKDATADRWLASDPLNAELPPGVRSTLGRFLGTDGVETLDEWAEALRQHADGDAITVADLCVTDEPTPHRGATDGRTYHFACFYDAVILAAIEDRPVEIRTESPAGAVVEARSVGTEGLTVDPPGAVFSFGIDEAVDPPGEGGPSFERGYAAICPYVRAFADRDAYERWAAEVPAATVAMPLAGATDLAAALVE